jgi:hypothetical protein
MKIEDLEYESTDRDCSEGGKCVVCPCEYKDKHCMYCLEDFETIPVSMEV